MNQFSESAVDASPKPKLALRRYCVDTVRFSRTNFANIVPALEAFFSGYPQNNYACVNNVHITVECRKNSRLRAILNGSYLTIADGQPLIWYGRLSGIKSIERIMGPDLMTAVFCSPEGRLRRHFFLGGNPSTLKRMHANLESNFPGIRIAGMHSPPFRKLSRQEEEEQTRMIQEAKPDYLWVCFGAPKQEYWVAERHRLFPHTLLIGIGAGFAYHAGELKRAPVLFQKLGLEWIWRLAQDPRRLWMRYFRTNPIFVWIFIKLLMLRLVGRQPL